MLTKFQRWIGWTKPSGEEIQEERDALMRPEYFDSIENFPDRIDQFLDAINRLYISQKRDLSRIRQRTI